MSNPMHKEKRVMGNLPLAVSLLSLATLFGCSSDEPTSIKAVRPMQSALLAAPSVLAQAEGGTLGRGEQDFLVRFERALPGFGGLFIHDGHVYVYLKGSAVKAPNVRSVLARAYSTHKNPLVREALSSASQATILPAAYTLSELIAIEQRVASSRGMTPGYVGVGMSLRKNKVRVMFEDEAALLRARPALEQNGIPLSDVDLVVTGPADLQNGNFDKMYRPTGAGIEINLGNDTRWPGYWAYNFKGDYVYHVNRSYGTLGYNVRSSAGVDYFMTASHMANRYSGTNGAVGDTIWQGCISWPCLAGTITVNPPWGEGAACPVNPQTGTNFDLCTNADVMLGQYVSGVTHARRVATSLYGGVNGQVGSGGFKQFNDIVNVFPPEYADDVLKKDGAKTGAKTSTTSGPIEDHMATLDLKICWPSRPNCVPSKWLRLINIASFVSAHSAGDSGAPVFTNRSATQNGAPYAAMGIHVAGVGAGTPCTGTNCLSVFARWDQIEARLGVGSLNPRTTIP
jgi:hypothetical protein